MGKGVRSSSLAEWIKIWIWKATNTFSPFFSPPFFFLSNPWIQLIICYISLLSYIILNLRHFEYNLEHRITHFSMWYDTKRLIVKSLISLIFLSHHKSGMVFYHCDCSKWYCFLSISTNLDPPRILNILFHVQLHHCTYILSTIHAPCEIVIVLRDTNIKHKTQTSSPTDVFISLFIWNLWLQTPYFIRFDWTSFSEFDLHI